MAAIALATEIGELSGQKFYHRSFRGQNLSKQKLRGSLFFSCNFDEADLTEADCTGSDFTNSTFRNSILYRTNMRDCRLAGVVLEPKDAFGLTISLSCRTFDEMKISPLWSHAWLMFFCMMHHKADASQLVDGVIAAIGAEKYAKLRALFSKREL